MHQYPLRPNKRLMGYERMDVEGLCGHNRQATLSLVLRKGTKLSAGRHFSHAAYESMLRGRLQILMAASQEKCQYSYCRFTCLICTRSGGLDFQVVELSFNWTGRTRRRGALNSTASNPLTFLCINAICLLSIIKCFIVAFLAKFSCCSDDGVRLRTALCR